MRSEEERSTEGKQSNEETLKSSEEAGKTLVKTGKDRGGRRPPSSREQERNKGSGKGQGGKPAGLGKD